MVVNFITKEKWTFPSCLFVKLIKITWLKDPDVDLTPQVPAFKSDFTQNKKEEIPEIDEQPHIFKRIFFFFHPSQDEQQEETVGKQSSKGKGNKYR